MGPKLTSGEIRSAFDSAELRTQFPPILNVADSVRLLRLPSRKTLYAWIAKGRLDGAFRKRGKHLLFWRDRLINIIFNTQNWSDQ
jgi:hypothetical protein